MTTATRYFDHLTSVEEIKKLWRELAFQHHPDRGGDLRTMQEVNGQYHEALKRVNKTTSTGSDGKEHTYYYNEETEQAIINKVDELIRAGVLKQAEIFIIGTWIWVTGDTKPIKDVLGKNGCGLTFNGKRSAWFWTAKPGKSRYNKRASLGDLAAKYGATKVTANEQDEDGKAKGKSKAKGKRIAA